MIEYPTILAELVDHNVQKIDTDDGDITEIGTLRLNWKARGAKTGFQFSVYEMELTPGSGVPLHKHPFAEFFYVLEGTISYGRVNQQGALEWLPCNVGECILVPSNAPHATQNQSTQPAKMLSVSNFHHELILTNGGHFVQKDDPVPAQPNREELQRFNEVARQYQGYSVELGSDNGAEHQGHIFSKS